MAEMDDRVWVAMTTAGPAAVALGAATTARPVSGILLGASGLLYVLVGAAWLSDIGGLTTRLAERYAGFFQRRDHRVEVSEIKRWLSPAPVATIILGCLLVAVGASLVLR